MTKFKGLFKLYFDFKTYSNRATQNSGKLFCAQDLSPQILKLDFISWPGLIKLYISKGSTFSIHLKNCNNKLTAV